MSTKKPKEFGKWVKCSDQLPEIPCGVNKSVTVICCWGDKPGNVAEMIFVRRELRGKTVERFEWNSRLSTWEVTHWMPLPLPPKKDEEDENHGILNSLDNEYAGGNF
jgi:hypothetical protein